MRGLACAIALCAACGFTPRGAGDDDDARGVDGAIDDAAGADARDPDGGGFDPNRCPPRFDHHYRGARYFLLPSAPDADYVDQALACADAAPGLAHMVVLSDAAEADHLSALVCPGGGCEPRIWVGLYSVDGVVWTTMTGEPDVRPWDTGANQPGDFDTSPTAAELNVSNGLMVDLFAYDVNARFATVCECDGRTQTLLLPDVD